MRDRQLRLSTFVAATIVILIVTNTTSVWGYEGYGAIATGGSNICRVTSLSNSGSGSLRNCLNDGNHVVFDVGGTIVLVSELLLQNCCCRTVIAELLLQNCYCRAFTANLLLQIYNVKITL